MERWGGGGRDGEVGWRGAAEEDCFHAVQS